MKNNIYLERFFVKKNNRLELINVNDLVWLESDGNYVNLYTEDQKYLIRHTLSGIEEQLNPRHFSRIHRSYIVNIDKIRSVENHQYGSFHVLLKNGRQIKMSKNYNNLIHSLQNF